jgi:CRP-like cAMP-binding protein
VKSNNTPRVAPSGTTAYWPPERFKRRSSADAPSDMWSVGVILYIMLTGVHPFDPEGISTDTEIEARIRSNPRPPLDQDLVGHLSDSAIDLIMKLMHPDPRRRLTAYQMLQHPWVRGETASKEKIQDSDKKLSKFKDLRYKLEAGMIAVLLKQAHQDVRMSEAKVSHKNSNKVDLSVNIMKRAFDVFDSEGKGYVSSSDLDRVALETTGSVLAPDDTKEYLIERADDDGEATLSLSQFTQLFSGLRQKHYPRGHYIFHAGEIGDAMYFLSSGKVEVQTRKGQLVAILRAGDFFGEGCLVDSYRKRFTSAKCTTPVDVLEIRREDLDRYMGVSESLRTELKVKWRARSLAYAKNLLRLQTNLRILDLKKGDVVYKEGDIGTSMYRVDDSNGGELSVLHGNNLVHKYTAGDSFGESSLLFERPRSSTVICASDTCRLHEMQGKDFKALIKSSPEMAASLRNMCQKRVFKKAVKAFSLANQRGISSQDIIDAFHRADVDHSGTLNLDEIRNLFHAIDPTFPDKEIQAFLDYVDVDQDGQVTLVEFKRLFRQFDESNEGE